MIELNMQFVNHKVIKMKLKLSKTQWERIGKQAGWQTKDNPSVHESDSEVLEKWKQFQKEDLIPDMDTAMIDMQKALINGDKMAYDKAESKFDWASKQNERAKAEIARLSMDKQAGLIGTKKTAQYGGVLSNDAGQIQKILSGGQNVDVNTTMNFAKAAQRILDSFRIKGISPDPELDKNLKFIVQRGMTLYHNIVVQPKEKVSPEQLALAKNSLAEMFIKGKAVLDYLGNNPEILDIKSMVANSTNVKTVFGSPSSFQIGKI